MNPNDLPLNTASEQFFQKTMIYQIGIDADSLRYTYMLQQSLFCNTK
jgi:hypothetical protein